MGVSLNSYVYAEINGFGVFDKVQGGELAGNVTDYIPGGERSPQKISGTYTLSDITISRAWDPLRDRQVVEWAKRCIVQGIVEEKVLVKYTKDAAGIIMGQQSYKVKPKSSKTPDGSNGDDGIAEFSVVLAVTSEL